MLKIKIAILSLTSVVWLWGCKLTTIPFKEKNINLASFNKVPSLWIKPTVTRIDSVTVFRAELREEDVNQDGIAELKIINTQSNQSRGDALELRNYHYLYLFQVFTDDPDEILCIFLASSFSRQEKKGDHCTRLGPAYLGRIRMEQMQMEKVLKIDSKETSFLISGAMPTNILFIANHDIPAVSKTICNQDTTGLLCRFGIKEIINSNRNKIGGTKPVIYSINKIFADPDALVFTYYKTIRQ